VLDGRMEGWKDGRTPGTENHKRRGRERDRDWKRSDRSYYKSFESSVVSYSANFQCRWSVHGYPPVRGRRILAGAQGMCPLPQTVVGRCCCRYHCRWRAGRSEWSNVCSLVCRCIVARGLGLGLELDCNELARNPVFESCRGAYMVSRISWRDIVAICHVMATTFLTNVLKAGANW
jgi:hypothetical protein